MVKKLVANGDPSPLVRWFRANRDDPGLGDALRLLLGHALVTIFRKNSSDFFALSPERAVSFAQRLPGGVLPGGLGGWLSDPVRSADEIIRFCEGCEAFRLPRKLCLSEASHGEVDLRGVRCPMGSVRARLVLAGMEPGEEATFFLDDGEPIENVPRAMLEDGNLVLSREKKENYWRISVRKRNITV